MEPELTAICSECRSFVLAVQGIRGPLWQGRQKAGLSHSYRDFRAASVLRDGSVSASPDFFDLFRDKTCARVLDHLADQDDPRAHTRGLRPIWIARLLGSVDFKRKVGLDAATRLAAAVLGISERSFSRRGA